jgi:carbon-monoxide dehydrogenase catalytic subunit
LDIAKDILRTSIDNYKNRGEIQIPDYRESIVPGFSHEYINYSLGGTYRSSFRPLNDAIMSGRIRGLVGIVGCSNPREKHDALHVKLTKELIKQDVLVVETGCSSIASAKQGLLVGEAGLDEVGPGLREICETIGIPPVLHMGSCVDNSRILTVLAQVVEEGGLGEDISEIPVVGLAPEWMSEKAISIATYVVASGVYTIMSGTAPLDENPKVEDSVIVPRLLSSGWEEKFGARLEFINDFDTILEKTLEHIDKKRADLGLPAYDPEAFGKSGDARMIEFEKMPLKDRREAIYG